MSNGSTCLLWPNLDHSLASYIDDDLFCSSGDPSVIRLPAAN